MKKSTRRRPELEPLEAVVLMSAVAKVSAPVQLEGTFALKSHEFPAEAGLIPASTGFVGSGNLGKFGRTTVVVESLGGSPPLYVIGLGDKSGYLALGAQITLPAKGASTSASYQAFDGDGGAIDHANETGTVTISDVVTKGGKSSYVLKLS